MKKRVVKQDGESGSPLLSLVKRVSEVVGESRAYSICEILQCTREELATQSITNEQLHWWYQSLMYAMQRYHLRYANDIKQLEAIIAENPSIETIKQGE